MAQAPRARDWQRWAPLTGVVFVVVLVLSFLVGGETPSADDSATEVVSFYTDNEGEMFMSAFLAALAAVFFLFFVGHLTNVLRSGERAGTDISGVARAGGIVAAVGMLIFAGLTFTLGDVADELEPEAAQALNALNADFFFPLAGGIATFLLATGLVAVRSRVLPPWLSWAALVIGVASFTPLGFFAFLASIAWVLVASIVLTRAVTAPPVAGTTEIP